MLRGAFIILGTVLWPVTQAVGMHPIHFAPHVQVLPLRTVPETLPVALTEDECWAIDHQIRCDLTVNNKPVGRAILLKTFPAVLARRGAY